MKNLFLAWREFKRGKTGKADVQKFEMNLEDNIFELHEQLKSKHYRHSPYHAFYVRDPKLRHIHKACVRDRVVHHALFRMLYPFFDKTFIFDSYSCRVNKGTHRGVDRLTSFLKKVSHNNRRLVWAMKCDIKKFFDSIDQKILKQLIAKKITDPDILWLVDILLQSFEHSLGKGLPLGNVSSQLFANIYLNELDQFVKHKLKVKHYLRYCDDFVFISEDRNHLLAWYETVKIFLEENLKLTIHENKTIIRKHRQGIDFLGYVVLPYHRVLRTKTKRRIFKKFAAGDLSENSIQSYLGVLKHCNGYKLKQKLSAHNL